MVYIGGLQSFLFSLIGIVLRYYNKLSFLKTIANNTYFFYDEAGDLISAVQTVKVGSNQVKLLVDQVRQ